jgi:double zinc ribbon protein
MQFAIFGIDNGGLNLVANLFVMALVVVWLALIVWTYLDARRRIEDPVLVACATGASLFPYVGTFVYSILRPPEFLDDVKERELEIKAAELRVRQLSELSCPNCRYPVEKSYLRCPRCQRRLKDPCQSCGKPVDPRWAICPYCETELPGSRQRQQKREADQRKPPRKAPQRPATGRRTATAQRPPQRTSSPTSDAGSAEPSERPRAARPK